MMNHNNVLPFHNPRKQKKGEELMTAATKKKGSAHTALKPPLDGIPGPGAYMQIMDLEAFEAYMKFVNTDISVSEALEDVPDFEGEITFSDEHNK